MSCLNEICWGENMEFGANMFKLGNYFFFGWAWGDFSISKQRSDCRQATPGGNAGGKGPGGEGGEGGYHGKPETWMMFVFFLLQ